MTKITVHFHARGPGGRESHHEVECKTGVSLMKAALQNDIDGIAADCGGSMTCATCHVYLRDPWAARVPPPAADELAFLDFVADERRPHSRLSCQIELTPELDGLEVELPSRQY